jgi:hypothetical protein
MGYPMTWRRLINRNGLADGDYEAPPRYWMACGGAMNWAAIEQESAEKLLALMRTIQEHRERDANAANNRLKLFVGDLRRLERDTLDEGFICQEIARRTGFDAEMVAAVLREWLAV